MGGGGEGVGRYWIGGGGGNVTGFTLVGVTVWSGRYVSGPGAAGSARGGGFGAARGTSSLNSSSLSWFLASWLWLRESSSSRLKSRDRFSSSSGSSFTGFTWCANEGAATGTLGRTGRNVPGASSPRPPRGLQFYRTLTIFFERLTCDHRGMFTCSSSRFVIFRSDIFLNNMSVYFLDGKCKK